jgi:predicted O-methyltransferase YrrM
MAKGNFMKKTSSKQPMYKFEFDWFSCNIPRFQYFLNHLRDSNCSLLEIGSFEGRSATWLLENVAMAPDSHLHCVDIFEQAVLRSNIDLAGGSKRTTIHIGRSGDILRRMPDNSFDFIYIDGGHSQIEVLEDAVLSFSLAKPDGIIAFDDYLWNEPTTPTDGSPKISIDFFTNIYRNRIEILEYGYQVWIKKLPV